MPSGTGGASHPCFTSADRLDDHTLYFAEGYFSRGPRTQRWGPFETHFVGWHRTLADYLRAFAAAPDVLCRYRMFPFSVAVRLRRLE